MIFCCCVAVVASVASWLAASCAYRNGTKLPVDVFLVTMRRFRNHALSESSAGDVPAAGVASSVSSLAAADQRTAPSAPVTVSIVTFFSSPDQPGSIVASKMKLLLPRSDWPANAAAARAFWLLPMPEMILPRPYATSMGDSAYTNVPRAFTAACHRSSMAVAGRVAGACTGTFGRFGGRG